jgi:hypothetical protein
MKVFFLVLLIHVKTLLCSKWLETLPSHHVKHLKACSFCWTELNAKLQIWEKSSNQSFIALSAQLATGDIVFKIFKEGLEKQNRELRLKLNERVVELSNNSLSKKAIIESQEFKIKEMNDDINNLYKLFKELKGLIGTLSNNLLIKKKSIPKVEKMDKIFFELIQKGSDKREHPDNVKEVREINQDPSVNLEIVDVQKRELFERDQTIPFSKPQSENAEEFENKIHNSHPRRKELVDKAVLKTAYWM